MKADLASRHDDNGSERHKLARPELVPSYIDTAVYVYGQGSLSDLGPYEGDAAVDMMDSAGSPASACGVIDLFRVRLEAVGEVGDWRPRPGAIDEVLAGHPVQQRADR